MDLYSWTYNYTRGGWDEILDSHAKTIRSISKKLASKGKKNVVPAIKDVWRALEYTDLSNVRVVLLGQDPYINRCDRRHVYNKDVIGTLQACGLSFSVRPGIKTPPSLVRIFKELEDEGYTIPESQFGCLRKWARRGVLLINTVLTADIGESNSHKDIGWDSVINNLLWNVGQENRHIAWVFLGKPAQQYKRLVAHPKHQIFTAGHPSPLNRSVPFIGTNVFRNAADHVNQDKTLPKFTWNLDT